MYYFKKKFNSIIGIHLFRNLPELDKKKFLCPGDLSVGAFLYVIRKRLKLDSEHALFLYVKGNTLPPTSALLSQVYSEHA